MPKVPLTSEERVELILSLAEQAGKQARGESPAALQELLRQTPEEILADPDLRMALRLHEVRLSFTGSGVTSTGKKRSGRGMRPSSEAVTGSRAGDRGARTSSQRLGR